MTKANKKLADGGFKILMVAEVGSIASYEINYARKRTKILFRYLKFRILYL